jgi:phosphoglycolate phosphatase-like HAD superfamily hydrolase
MFSRDLKECIMSGSDPLPSWNDCDAKQSIIDFVASVSTSGSADYVPVNERIAVFDNDGTLWCEMPVPVQVFFMSDRVKALASRHPEWQRTEPFKSILAGDIKTAMATGLKGVAELEMATHAGMTTDEFVRIVREWLATARHPKFSRAFTAVIYQPMLEVLAHLRSRGFSTFIVSGGGAEFMRVFAEDVYGIPPHQVIGTTIKTHFEFRKGKPLMVRDPALDFFDDKAGKPVNINKYIGHRPIACFGNSDGDREMLMWTTLGREDGRPSFGLLVHHTDAEREFAYDRGHVLSGQLDKGLGEAAEYGWVLADMKKDWRVVFPAAARSAQV